MTELKAIFERLNKPYIKGSEKDLQAIINGQAYYNDLAKKVYQIIKNDKFFSSLGNVLIAKIYDEITTPLNTPYQFQIFIKKTKNNISIEEKPKELYNRINILYKGQKITLNQYSDCALKRLLLPRRWTDEELNDALDIRLSTINVKNIVRILQRFNLSANNYRILKQLYKALIEHILTDYHKIKDYTVKNQVFEQASILYHTLDPDRLRLLQ